MGGARKLAFAVLPILVLVVGGEAALRVAGWPAKVGNGFTHKEVYWVEAPSQYREPHPHKETGGTFRVTTDENGLRAPLHPERKPDGVVRVLALGCSTTFGWGVDDEQSWPARLEAILNEGGHAVEVVNGAQPGYTSFQGLWLWDKVLYKYEPDVVVFGYLVQDARKVGYSDRSQAILQGNGDFLKQHLLYRSRVYLGLKEGVDAFRIRAKDAEPDVYRVPPEEYVENLRAFKQRVEDVGAKLVLFGFPLEREGYTGEHRRVLHAAAEVLPAPLYDPQPQFEQMSASETLFFPQDRGHANAAGLEKIAQGMAQFLVAERLVP